MMTPADLISQKCCTAACLVASTTDSRCRCACLGRYHGLLISADVTTLVDGRRVIGQPDTGGLSTRRWSA